jgi:Ca2+-binding RTX toxin-like protein
MEIATGANGDYSVTQIDFTVVPDPASLPNTLDPILVNYTLTDTDGQSDTAQLAIYTIDNEITCTVGADSITGGALNDAITGDAGDDVLSGGDGNDSISGGAGEDTLSGNDGNDYLSGGDDADTLAGGAGQDHLDGDAGDDIVDGGTGDDIVLGGTGNDLVFGGAGDDRLEGEEGDDTLSGGSGNDTLVGGDGSDTLDGGAGADIVNGGRGADSIVFDENDTHIDGGTGFDTLLISNDVLDFSALSDGTIENIEKLDLNSADAQSISLSLDDVLDMTDANHVLEITGGEGDEITFAGVQGPGADWTYNGGGLFTHINGIDQVQIVSSDDPDNHVQMFTDDGTPIESS